ncbi:MAG: TonB-dependent receptor [Bacteroidales bacterium]|nr:TonB-dependent receptor [Bacteroidales bacterium]
MGKKLLFLLVFSLFFAENFAQIDTSVQFLEGISVEGKAERSAISTTVPVQTITQADIQTMPAVLLSDVLKLFSGIVIKDYGGVGGMKTVSMRGFGSQHTAISYDGLPVTDCQTGQIDLSKFSLENVEQISVNSGTDDIFLPARLFAAANLIQIRTLRPKFDKRPFHIDFRFLGGSFGLWSPSVLLENRIVKRRNNGFSLSSSLNINYLQSDGRYPFTIYYGGDNDSTSLEKRSNSDVRSMNIEGNLFFTFDYTTQMDVKFYYYQAERGLPGAVIFYNTHSRQRLYDQNAFGQVHFLKHFLKNVDYQLNAKFNYAYERYFDPDYLNAAGFVDNRYFQREYYLSNGVSYRPHKIVNLTLVNDLIFGNLTANLPNFILPSRLQVLTVLSAAVDTRFVQAKAALLHTGVANWAKKGAAADNVSRFSPSAGISIRPMLSQDFHIRAFYKNIFRLPTFNDLYYNDFGNRDLRPENTHQFDLGLTYARSFLHKKIGISITVDGYYNRVKDKIVAIPSRNLFTWMMLNFGAVKIAGMDANLVFDYEIIKQLKINIVGSYSLQQAVDVTDPKSNTYRHQIPYTPLHSGSASLTLSTPWVDVSYTVVAAGKRYALQQNVPANELKPYSDHSLALAKDFDVKGKVVLGYKLELLNLANRHYEIVRSYPMQGRSVRGTLRIGIK